MRLAVISDLHLDINRLDVPEVARKMADYLLKEQIAVYVLAGDSFNSLAKTREFVRQLNALLSSKVRVFYLAGNHEMGDGLSFEKYEDHLSDGYLHNQSVDLGDYRIIGNNGWYDYSFDHGQHDAATIGRFKKSFWYDRRIKQTMTDQKRSVLSQQQVKRAVNEARRAGQKPLIITHFSPDGQLVETIPFSKSKLAILKAYLGSEAFGEQLVAAHVPVVVSGHIHWRMPKHRIGETAFYNASLGYETKRIHEWSQKDFMTEWEKRLLILDL